LPALFSSWDRLVRPVADSHMKYQALAYFRLPRSRGWRALIEKRQIARPTGGPTGGGLLNWWSVRARQPAHTWGGTSAR
jgi:hypothetical protein